MVSMHFYSTSFQYYLGYGNDKATFETQIKNKPFSGGWTNTGAAINATVSQIITGGFVNSLPLLWL